MATLADSGVPVRNFRHSDDGADATADEMIARRLINEALPDADNEVGPDDRASAVKDVRTAESPRLAAARQYLDRGWQVIPVPYKQKGAELEDWPNLRLTADELPHHFAGRGNIGGLNGAPSKGLIDVDLDSPETVAAAEFLLPKTACVSGRESRPRSHHYYVVDTPPNRASEKFFDPLRGKGAPGRVLLELRSTGSQTIVPPSTHPDGDLYGWDEDGEPAHLPCAELDWAVRLTASAALLARYPPAKGARQDAALALAGLLLRGGLSEDDTALVILTAATVAEDEEAAKRAATARHTAEKLAAGKPVTGFSTARELFDEKILSRVAEWLHLTRGGDSVSAASNQRHLTDAGNAERFVAYCGDRVRYATGLGWLHYDNQKWACDEEGIVVQRLGVETARAIFDEARQEEDPGRRALLAKHALQSEQSPRIAAMVRLAQSAPGIYVPAQAFDANPWLLNTLNGTVDLRTGKRLAHKPHDYLTKLAGAAYRPGARHARWDAFLRDVTDGDVALAIYLQRWAGMCVTGDMTEKKIALGIGPTDSGKGTFVDALSGALGDYAVTTPFDTFLDRGRQGRAPRDDLAELVGARLIVSQEVNEGARFDSALLKTWSGDDELHVRHLYRRGFSFRPQGKLFFMVNDAPHVNPDDAAFWNRMRRIPFRHVVSRTDIDRGLKTFLRNDPEVREAVLAWAVQGCLDWKREGLQEPEAVRRETESYHK